MERVVSEFSQMEIGISDNRNENMCDGAKDTGKTALVECKIPTIDNDSEGYDSDSSDSYCYDTDIEDFKLYLACSDGVLIEDVNFKRESKLVQMRYNVNFGISKVDSDRKTLEMVKEFCAGRAMILDDDILLDEFNSKFLQKYRSKAIQLITAGFDLDIISLIDLMMEEVVNLFTTKWTEDEVYNFFFVNLKEYREDKFNVMKQDLLNYRAFLATDFSNLRDIYTKGLIDVRANDDWDYDLLKLKFHSLESYKQRRQWLTAHFLLRCSCLDRVYFFKNVRQVTKDVDLNK